MEEVKNHEYIHIAVYDRISYFCNRDPYLFRTIS